MKPEVHEFGFDQKPTLVGIISQSVQPCIDREFAQVYAGFVGAVNQR
jgi:hypothetical protein